MVLWKWGSGWFDQIIMSKDFAGAALFHWHAGGVVLSIASIICIFRPKGQRLPTRSISLFYWLPGIALYSVVVIAINAGSTLSAEPGLVIAVIQATLIAAVGCMVTMLICLLYTSPSPRDQRGSRMPSSA